ncbi:hypothetical protein Fbal_1471 [Ferrimonas balearica DSM 9799]|uniref:Uncharacterized protein n=1 Tax=Ferrimonas balearica (strain DSM 9799 / CCM 4581 / KCTC 23876 / PAT) TaxID=550540 RepID=E1SNJ1_FERBD|nr:hypothetical protein Fbal_1471 [Ferrimonas balearica DSM 9799]
MLGARTVQCFVIARYHNPSLVPPSARHPCLALKYCVAAQRSLSPTPPSLQEACPEGDRLLCAWSADGSVLRDRDVPQPIPGAPLRSASLPRAQVLRCCATVTFARAAIFTRSLFRKGRAFCAWSADGSVFRDSEVPQPIPVGSLLSASLSLPHRTAMRCIGSGSPPVGSLPSASLPSPRRKAVACISKWLWLLWPENFPTDRVDMAAVVTKV